MSVKIQIRRDLAANWGSTTVLASGEFGYETDTGNLKIGDGTTQWQNLAYYQFPNVSVNPAVDLDLNSTRYRVMGRYRLNSITPGGSTFTNVPTDFGSTVDADSVSTLIVTTHAYPSLTTHVQQLLTQYSSSGSDLRQWVRLWNGTAWTNWSSTAHISDGEITTAKIADDAVTAAKLADDASTDANRAVTTNHIRDVAVTTAKIADSAITNAKIANTTIAYGKLAADVLPVGCVQMFAGSAAPSGWLLCNGQLVSRTTYAALFTAISTSFGAGDGSTTFAVPDLRNRFAVGVGSTGFSVALGGTGGTADAIVVSHTHTGTTASSGAHTHTVSGATSGGSSGTGSNNALPSSQTTSSSGAHTHTFTTDSTGSSGSNANLPPYLGMNYIIRAV